VRDDQFVILANVGELSNGGDDVVLLYFGSGLVTSLKKCVPA